MKTTLQPFSLLSVSLTAVLLVASSHAQTPLTTLRVATGLSSPVDITAPRGDLDRLFIVEQGGRIRILKDGKLLSQPFLDIGSLTLGSGERGLLGLAFHPNYMQNGHFFVDYTDRSSGATMVVRYTVSSNPDVADASSAKKVLGPISQPYSNHNGGGLEFGPDGYLYISFGDGGSGNDPGCRAQSGSTMLGKLLRIDIDAGSQPYKVPTDNPFVKNSSVLNEIWALGLRNPWRFSFDRGTGDLYIGDVGQVTREEIDIQPGQSKGGENYGWRIKEGTLCHLTCAGAPACTSSQLVDPVVEHGRTEARSIIGGAVYRGCAIPDLRGTYFYADYVTHRIWSFRWVGGKVTNHVERTSELPGLSYVSAFGEDSCGEIYFANHRSGEIYKIVPRTPPPSVNLGFGKPGAGNQIPRFDACGILSSGNTAELRLFHAAPKSIAVLLASNQSNPQTVFGGTIAPWPIQQIFHFPTDSEGKVNITIAGGGGPLDIYAQFVVLDQAATFGMSYSNAIKVTFQK